MLPSSFLPWLQHFLPFLPGNHTQAPAAIMPNDQFYLFGFPIAHSLSPAFHNEVFRLRGMENQYELYSTSLVTPQALAVIKSERFGGASVTMPLKSAIIPHLDEISPESKATGAVNTIVKVRTWSKVKYVGTNTDILGIKNVLLAGIRRQYSEANGTEISSSAKFSKGKASGVILGGGATTRSAVYALSKMLGVHPIYLVNRDPQEVESVRASFPELVKAGSLIHLTHPDDVEKYFVDKAASHPPLAIIVGAIPAIKPVTKEERLVYTIASSLFTLPPPQDPNEPGRTGKVIPVPHKRVFLEMAYKPPRTPMLQVAAAHDWFVLDGIEAMIEQGLAQQRLWHSGSIDALVGSDTSILGEEVETAVRRYVEGMKEISISTKEVDQAIVAPAPAATVDEL